MANCLVYKYGQTLEIIEKFMTDSGIREYCTNICKGSCCGTCYKENAEACHKNEGRRLACSGFICFALVNLLSNRDRQQFSSLSDVVERQYHKFGLHDPYFRTPTKDFLDNSTFRSDVIDKLSKRMAIRIKKIITFLIKNNINVRKRDTTREYITEKIGGSI